MPRYLQKMVAYKTMPNAEWIGNMICCRFLFTSIAAGNWISGLKKHVFCTRAQRYLCNHLIWIPWSIMCKLWNLFVISGPYQFIALFCRVGRHKKIYESWQCNNDGIIGMDRISDLKKNSDRKSISMLCRIFGRISRIREDTWPAIRKDIILTSWTGRTTDIRPSR